MNASAIAPSAAAVAAPPGGGASPGSDVSFHAVLSALNPLQYLPVIGTIYRAVTGDTIPEPLRRIGSLIVSTLLGGPVGAGINLAMLAGEKATGIDLDRTGQAILRGGGSTAVASAGKAEAANEAAAPPSPAPDLPPQPWSPAQLSAYGVTSSDTGTLQLANLQGADVLNSLELSQIHMANAAYARVLSPPT